MTLSLRHALLFGVALLARVPAAEAQVEADRPGLTTGTAVMARGRAQVELGTPDAFFYRFGGATEFFGTVPLLLRVGVGQGVEARFATTVLSFTDDDVSFEAATEVEVGAKVRLFDGPARLSVVPSLVVPLEGSDEADVRGGLVLATEADLTPEWTVSASAGIVTDLDDSVVPIALSIERALSATTSAYGEVGATSVTGSAFGGAPPVVGVGLTQAFSSRAQGDVYVQRVLGQPRYNVGAGLTVLF